MKVAVIGSRGITKVNLKDFLPESTTEIVSGGARGVDTCARKYATEHNLILTEFTIIEYADVVLAFWDGKSRGTKFVIENCKKRNKEVKVYTLSGTV